MKIKITLTMLMALALLFAFMPLALAEENATQNASGNNVAAVLLEENFTADDSNETVILSEDNNVALDEAVIADLNDSTAEMLSKTNTGWKKFLLLITFNKDKKIDAEMSLAKVYLAKANIALKSGDIEGFKIAMSQYENILSNIIERIQSIKEGSVDEDLLLNAATTLAGIQGQINVHGQKLENLLNLLADSNITDEQRAEINVSITKVQNIISELNQVKTEKENELKIKIMAMGNRTEAEVDTLISDIEEDKNFTGVYAISTQLRIMHAEKTLEKVTKFLDDGEAAGKNVSEIRAKLNVSEQTIQQAWALYNAGDYKAAIQLIEPISAFERYMLSLVNKADKEEDSTKKDLILKEMSAEKKEILENQIDKKKEILEAQWEKKQETLENQIDKKREILQDQIDKKKEISASLGEKEKEILQAQSDKKKEILQDQIDHKKEILNSQRDHKKEISDEKVLSEQEKLELLKLKG